MPIRPADTQDIPAIQNLLSQILALHHKIRPDLFKAQGGKYSEDSLEALFASPETPVFVYADESNQVLGHLFLQIKSPDTPIRTPVKTLYIDDLCVAESARGQGIGQKLYDFARNYAKNQNCYNLTLNVWDANTGALRFYQRQGLTSQQIQLEEVLED